MFYVYIMASASGVLYTGVTNDLRRRVREHKGGDLPGFTATYKVNRLVYFQEFSSIREAIATKKRVKGWTRVKKGALIASLNPGWKDLAAGLDAEA